MTSRISTSIKAAALRFKQLDGVQRIKAHQVQIMVGVAGAGFMTTASAQTAGVGGLCALAGWLKTIAGVVALLAVAVMVINSFFGKSEIIGEIVTKVLIGCVILVAAGFLVSSTGLTQSCSGF